MLRPIVSLFLCLSIIWSLPGACQRIEAQPQERTPRLVTGRYGMPAVVVGTHIYVVGGAGPSGYRSDVERIDTQSQNLNAEVLRMPLRSRVFHTAEADGPFIYVMGGMTIENGEIHYITQVERLDTRDGSVELMAPLPMGLRNPASAIVNGKIYVVGGSIENGDHVGVLLSYDIATNTWKQGAPLPETKECEILPWHGGLLAVGGFNGEKSLAGVQSYDIATDKWTELPSLPLPTSAHHGAVVSDRDGNEHVLLFGDYTESSRVQIGEPHAGTWRSIRNSAFMGRRHAAVVTIGPKIYVIGGNVASIGSFTDEIQVLDPEILLAP